MYLESTKRRNTMGLVSIVVRNIFKYRQDGNWTHNSLAARQLITSRIIYPPLQMCTFALFWSANTTMLPSKKNLNLFRCRETRAGFYEGQIKVEFFLFSWTEWSHAKSTNGRPKIAEVCFSVTMLRSKRVVFFRLLWVFKGSQSTGSHMLSIFLTLHALHRLTVGGVKASWRLPSPSLLGLVCPALSASPARTRPP